MKLYIAAQCQIAALEIADRCKDAGHTITSRWLHQPFAPTETHTESECEEIAIQDFDDVTDADALILIAADTKPPGGKFVEAGIAMGQMKPVCILGRRENMLLWHPSVKRFDNMLDLLNDLEVTPREEEAAHTIFVQAGVRYWKDAVVNGIEDTNGTLIPCREMNIWKPIIDAKLGQIVNWDTGKFAEIHYTVCDAGEYYFGTRHETLKYKDDYVPSWLSPNGEGYGDYITMTVDKNGFIANWQFEFVESEWQ